MLGKILSKLWIAFLVFVGTYMVYDVFILKYYHLCQLKKHGIKTSAVLGSSSRLYNAKSYSFQVNDTVYSGGFALLKLQGTKKGDTISVMYLPENPAINSITQDVDARLVEWISGAK